MSQTELGYRWRPHKETIVNISREGKILFNGQGRHRLAIAKILNINKVAVSVLVLHNECDLFDTNFELS